MRRLDRLETSFNVRRTPGTYIMVDKQEERQESIVSLLSDQSTTTLRLMMIDAMSTEEQQSVSRVQSEVEGMARVPFPSSDGGSSWGIERVFMDEESLQESRSQDMAPAVTNKRLHKKSNNGDHDGLYPDARSPRCWKYLTMFALMATGASVGHFSYLFGLHQRVVSTDSLSGTPRFKNGVYSRMQDEAQSLIDRFHRNRFQQELDLVSISQAITAMSTSPQWPRVTVDDFDLRSFPVLQHQRVHSKASLVFSPWLSTDEDLTEWEAYVRDERHQTPPDKTQGGTESATLWQRSVANSTVQPQPYNAAPYSPAWQVSPSHSQDDYKFWNLQSDPIWGNALNKMSRSHVPIRSEMVPMDGSCPLDVLVAPILDRTPTEDTPGDLVGSISFKADITSALSSHESNRQWLVVLQDSCSNTPRVVRLWQNNTCECLDEDLNELISRESLQEIARSQPAEVHAMEQSSLEDAPFAVRTFFGLREAKKDILNRKAVIARQQPVLTLCQTTVTVFANEDDVPLELDADVEHKSRMEDPLLYSVVVAVVALFGSGVFLVYSWSVERYQRMFIDTAMRSRQLVNSFFPSVVRDRVVRSSAAIPRATIRNQRSSVGNNAVGDGNESSKDPMSGEPIAELFHHTTIMFADIAGFTAWSSQREPQQVFELLETLYHAFDTVAKRLGVFKVETIGDCYVAVTGLPVADKDHALVMAKFATECMAQMKEVTRRLEVTLGPGTSDLGLRVGLHSGPVTAGVLRGEKARFQLFGDTMNTAARMESNGDKNKIQTSQATADLICVAGKRHWLIPRADKVKAKGKGEMQTFWLHPQRQSRRQLTRPDTPDGSNATLALSLPALSIVSSSDPLSWVSDSTGETVLESPNSNDEARHERLVEWTTDLLLGILHGDAIKADRRNSMDLRVQSFLVSNLVAQIRTQLRMLIKHIAEIYPELPYHNFEHASVMAMFASKLTKQASRQTVDLKWGDRYDALTDPMVLFATVLSALVRDMCRDHSGECIESLWALLNQAKYSALFNFICPTDQKRQLFHQIFADCIMIPDFSGDRRRRSGFARASKSLPDPFIDEAEAPANLNLDVVRVLQLIIQASDIAHALQHWHIFSEWNERMFHEEHDPNAAILLENPAATWYQRHLSFLNTVAFPLANQLRDHALGEEFLICALENHREWKVNGQEFSLSLVLAQKILPRQNSPIADCA